MEEREEAEDPEDRVALEERSGDGREGGRGTGGEGGAAKTCSSFSIHFYIPHSSEA